MQEANHDQHPLAAFKMRAVVDFLQVIVTTTTPTQGKHLHNRLPPEWRSFADPQPLDGEIKAACTRFIVTIQDPPSVSAIEEGLALAQAVPQGIHAIEVALDLYGRQPHHGEQLAQVAYHLRRHLATPPQATPRITEPGHYRAAVRPNDVIKALQDGYTINTGMKDAPHRVRAYVKRADSTGRGRYSRLPPAQHRARLEVTLSGPACPVKTLADLAAFRFETLSHHFAQVESTASSSPFAAMLTDQLTQLGKPADDKARAQHRRQSRVCTRRDTVENKRIHDVLRRLTSSRKNAGISVFSDHETALPAPCSAVSAPSSKYFKNNSNHSLRVSDFNKAMTKKRVSDFDQEEQAALPESLASLAQEAARSAPGPSIDPALADARAGSHHADLSPLIDNRLELEALDGVFPEFLKEVFKTQTICVGCPPISVRAGFRGIWLSKEPDSHEHPDLVMSLAPRTRQPPRPCQRERQNPIDLNARHAQKSP